MKNPLTRGLASRAALLFVVLVCLCTSRGEGLHLLPYAGAADPTPAENAYNVPFMGLYQLSKAPEESRDFLDKTAQTSDTPAQASESLAYAPDRPRTLLPPVRQKDLGLIFHPRRLLTSSSDRSPPVS